ncbi:hypothetical protein NDU88_010387 [Pleurodeles waltl]|uniref:Uncharacterized protein n=1 Tax=Pleurodeles waltl TaxID=8319 RepID=A0AAV7PUR6_PLEWA|nr:hypothetical protein NDU88_010387 [Pleurodeles waltl]
MLEARSVPGFCPRLRVLAFISGSHIFQHKTDPGTRERKSEKEEERDRKPTARIQGRSTEREVKQDVQGGGTVPRGSAVLAPDTGSLLPRLFEPLRQ